MRYTTTNLEVSMTLCLADMLRAKGYDIYWHATGTTDAHTTTSGGAKGTITLVPDFPANPTYIVRLKSENAGPEEIVLPALTLHCLRGARRVEHVGLGHADYLWERHVLIDGLARDEFQQRELADLLHEWLNDEWRKRMPMGDFGAPEQSANTATEFFPPDFFAMSAVVEGQGVPALHDAYVEMATTDREELSVENEAARHYLRADVLLRYYE
jgi:hypothetical protein